MKKMIAVLLTVMMLVAMTACGTAPADDGEGEKTDTTPKKNTPWLLIGIGVGAAVLIAGGIVVFLLLRKKKAE